MSLQSYAINTGANAQMWILDMAPSRDTPVHDAGGPDGRRWREGDPVPMRLLWDYQTAVEAVERNPTRYRPERMSDAEHAEMIKTFEESRE